MKYIFTFGHEHGRNSGRFLCLEGSYSETRDRMFNWFGNKWAFQYTIDEWKHIENEFARKGYPLETEISLEEALENRI